MWQLYICYNQGMLPGEQTGDQVLINKTTAHTVS